MKFNDFEITIIVKEIMNTENNNFWKNAGSGGAVSCKKNGFLM